MIHDFNKSVIAGARGEEKIIRYLQAKPETINILDVRNDRNFQMDDVDLIVDNKHRKGIKIEIKTDSYYPRNFFYEYISNQEKNVMGCMEKTKADYIFYYYENYNTLYIIDTKELRAWVRVAENFDKMTKKTIKNKAGRMHEGNYFTSIGYTLPVVLLDGKYNWIKKFTI